MRPASLRDLSFGSSSDCSTYLIHLHGETPATTRSVHTDALQSAVSTAAPSPQAGRASPSPPQPAGHTRRSAHTHAAAADADAATALRTARLSAYLSTSAPHAWRNDDDNDNTTATAGDEAAAAGDAAAATTTTALRAVAQHAAQHGKDAAARLLLRWLHGNAAAANDNDDKRTSTGDRARGRSASATTPSATVTATTSSSTQRAPLPLGFDGVFDDTESPSYRDYWLDTGGVAVRSSATDDGAAATQQQPLASSSYLSAASRARLWSLLQRRGGLDVPLGVQRVRVSPPQPTQPLREAAVLSSAEAAGVLAALRDGEEEQQQQRLAAALAAATAAAGDNNNDDDAWDLSNIDVDLVSGLRNYCTHPNEWFAHLVAAALNTRALHGHPVTARELAEAHSNPFLVRMILAAHCLDENDAEVQQHVQDTVDALLSMHSEGADAALYEYLCAFLPLPYVRLSDTQASQLERCGFEYIKLMYDHRHVLPCDAPHSIVVNYAYRTLVLNVVAVVADLLLTLLCCVVIALTVVRWMDHGRASDVNFGFYTLLVLGGGYAVHIIAVIFLLRSRQPERVYEVTTRHHHHHHHHEHEHEQQHAHGLLHHHHHRHHHRHALHVRMQQHQHHHGDGDGLVLPSPYLLSLPILPLFEAVTLVTCVRARRCRWLILMHNCLVAARLAGLCFAACFAVPQLLTQSLLESLARGGDSDRAHNRWYYMFDFLTTAALVQWTCALVRFVWMSAVYCSTDAFGFARFNLRHAQQLDRRFKRTFNVLHVVSIFLFETDVYLLIACIMRLPSIDGGCRFLPVTLISLASIGGICIAVLFIWLAVSPHLTLRIVFVDVLIFLLHLTIFAMTVRRRYDHCATFKREVLFRYFVFGYYSCCAYFVVMLVLIGFGLMFAVQSPMAATVCGMLMSCALRAMKLCQGSMKDKTAACGDGDDSNNNDDAGDAAAASDHAAATATASSHADKKSDDAHAAAASHEPVAATPAAAAANDTKTA